MTTPQTSIFNENSIHHYFLEYKLHSNIDNKTLITALSPVLSSFSAHDVEVVVAFGKNTWELLSPSAGEIGLKSFESLNGVDGYMLPSTQNDILVWIHSAHHDSNFDQALAVQHCLQSIAKLELELIGFKYHDSRDLTGFVDGSANPTGEDARVAALIPVGEPGEGGSFVLTQQWVHDLARFNQLSQAEQEKVIGRTKPDSVEFSGADMPSNSHVSRTDVKLDNTALKIYRRSAPYGTVAQHGLYFIAFSCQLMRFEVILQRMFGVSGDNKHDRLIEFSKAISGAYWFAPSRETLGVLFREEDRSLSENSRRHKGTHGI
ncbi:MAG: Dyp-type peroxidase [Gammaproteobacteria bacterium]|nr:Dyp-type peroxidase [Gammaproteobacteria bacterium]